MLSLMYEYAVTGETGNDTINVMGDILAEKLSSADEHYIEDSFAAFVDNQKNLDEMIAASLKSWHIDRLSRLDLSILRLALIEITEDADIPEKVSINEAVELAKKYSSDKAPKFINGVLAGCLKQIASKKE